MDEISLQPSFGQALGRRAESAGIRLGCDLNQTSTCYPVIEQPGLARKNRIAFGMGDDWGQPSHLDLIKDAVELVRNELVRKFNQQVGALVDSEIQRRLDNLLNVVVGR